MECVKPGHLKSAYRVAQRFMAAHPAASLSWDWGPAIFLYGLDVLDSDSDSIGGRDYLGEYFAHHVSRGLAVDWSDRCASGLAAWRLARQGPGSVAASACEEIAAYLSTAPRNELGALDHLGTTTIYSRLYPRSIWVDSLMMYAVFAVAWGRERNDDELVRFGADQPLIFAAVLQNELTGLFGHAWDWEKRLEIPHGGVMWLRGNGWAALSMASILELLPKEYPTRRAIEAVFSKLVLGLFSKQRSDGLWGTLLDEQDSYPEASGSALAAAALCKAIRLGILPATCGPAVNKAFEALSGFDTGQSCARRVSGPTIPLWRWLYRVIPCRREASYGVGAYLILASEIEKLGSLN